MSGLVIVAISQLGGERLGLLTVFVLLRLVALFHNQRICAQVLAQDPTQALASGLLRRLEWGLFAAGLGWGLFAWLLPEPHEVTPSGQFLVIALVAIVGVVIHVTAPARRALLAYMAGFWALILARLAISDDPQSLILFGGALVYGSIVTIYGLRLHEQIREGIVSALENQALVSRLSALRAREAAQRGALDETNRQLNEALATANHLASHDALTNVMNRRAFLAQLPTTTPTLVGADRRASAALVLIDLDHFKRVNDRFGHQTGDDVLRETAALLRANLRSTDQLARWGGEEFVLLMPATERGVALNLTERLRAALNHACMLPDHDGIEAIDDSKRHLSASFGVSILHGAETFESALARADSALYRAKAQGRNRVICAD